MTSLPRLSIAVVLALLLSTLSSAQVATGTPRFGTFTGGSDTINMANLNINYAFQVHSKAGRGMPFTYALTFDNSIWNPVTSGGTTSWQPVTNWGWKAHSTGLTSYVTYKVFPCGGGNVQYTDWVWHDPAGTQHPIPALVGTCQAPGYSTTATTGVTSEGYKYTISMAPSATVFAPGGAVIVPPVNAQTGSGSVTDANGNRISITGTVFTDTLGTTVLTISGTNPVTYSYTAPSGATASVTVNYTTFSVQTNFGVSGVAEYGPLNQSLVSSIVFPDGTSYQFTYEPTPGFSGKVTGRLASVTLPTGGSISYSYFGGSNGILSDGTTAGFNRTVNDGTTTFSPVGMWLTGTGETRTVDHNFDGQETWYKFSGMFELERKIWSKREPPNTPTGVLVRALEICYNNNNPCGAAVTLPITQTDVYVKIGDRTSRTLTFFNDKGLPTETREWDFQTVDFNGPPLRKILTTYAALGNNIVDRPASVIVKDGADNPKAQSTFGYDQSGVTATSGTPQHVAISGSRGNLTTVSSWVSGSSWLTKTFTYFDTGTPNVQTDVNGAQTSFVYGSGSCGNSFVTTINLPLSLSRSFAYNCTGGVQTSVTDENGRTTTSTFSDAFFWRPASVTDPLSNVVQTSFTGSTVAESSMYFNGDNSFANQVTKLDGLGRVRLLQQRQGPSGAGLTNLNSVQTDYDARGRSTRVTVPYLGTLFQTNSSGPATITNYDALNRPTLVTDAGGGTVALAYDRNNVLITVGPAPTGENSKRKQYEYDALGRLTSVCELTSASGSGTCGQTVTQTGFWTKYQYDPLGNLIEAKQNAQSASPQTRTFTYDGLGRMTSESNPETGTTNYFYDSASGCGNFPGDLSKKTDAQGNNTCFAYDTLRRLTITNTYSGPDSSRTPLKYFTYDLGMIGAITVNNPKGRLVGAYTTSCPDTCAKITDLIFSYNARGEITDTWQWSTNAGGYYHQTATYWPHGALNTLTGLSVMPTVTYGGLDGQGRVTTVSDSFAQNLVTGVTYNDSGATQSLGALTQVNFGSGDSDNFSFDPNTGRMAQYQFNVNSQAQVGALTWNANGSLASLNITDAFNTANVQTCSFTHDDLARIASVNCGTGKWNQTFSYDPYGNISKAASGTGISFQPTYNTTTNRISALPGFTPTYNNNGNLLTDSFHTYQWDAEGRPTSIDSVNVTYDALGRMVEQDRSGTYTQIVYSPTGEKRYLMNGQWLQKAFVPLPGGATAVYGVAGFPPTGVPQYYRHSDWLGSSRLASTPSRTMFFDGAYAPFGEDYALSGTSDFNFTGQNQDTVQGLYDFMFREYSPVQGRWISPDPAGLGAVDLTNPQSLNRYAYVLNHPMGLIDPLGLNPCDPQDPSPESCAILQQRAWWPGAWIMKWWKRTVREHDDMRGDREKRKQPNHASVCSNFSPPPAPSPAHQELAKNVAATEPRRLRTMGSPSDAVWFYNQVKSGGPWDYKRQGQQFERFGNFNFGVVAAAFGIEPTTILRGAGAYSVHEHPSEPWKDSGEPGFLLDYSGGWGAFGDDPNDQADIMAGMFYYYAGCYQ